MTDTETPGKSKRKQRLAGAVGLLLVGGISGGLIAATNSASAQAPAAASTTSAATSPDRGRPADGPASVHPGEKALTGTAAATAKAAALKAVPGGTVFRVETDADGATYEAHMTKADGTHVTVKFDRNFKVTAIQQGMGAGGHGRDGHGPGGPDGTSAAPSGGSA
ncbi:MAG: hypothetical protein QOE58_2732 [Actinomycetota bacterium]|nr:hypothetical protein [Actinomycetota bacterium]